jgi:hypothetical protein
MTIEMSVGPGATCHSTEAHAGQPISMDGQSLTPFFAFVSLQLSQRSGAVALFSTLGTWVMVYLDKDPSLAIALTVASGIVGTCAAWVGRMITSPRSSARREANGVALFNLILLVLAMYLMLYTRIGVIRTTTAGFFRSSPVVQN